jgi:uncharacterized phage protein (TIGR02218 family)
MSRTIHAGLQAKLDAGTAQLCHIISITRKDGTILRFTDHDQDVVIEGFTYQRDNSLAVAAITTSANNGMQSTNCGVIFSDDAVSEEHIARGLYDKAGIVFSVADWANPEYGKAILLTGQMSTIQATNKKKGSFEVRGLLSRGDVRIGEYYSPGCRVDLGDPIRCTVALATFTTTGTVSEVDTQNNIKTILASNPENGFYSLGVITFTSGDNTGISMEVLNQFSFDASQDSLYLALRMPYDIQPGDTFTLVAGCDKRPTTCKLKFNNLPNFRGEPFVPGFDFITDFLGTGSGNSSNN